MLLPTKDDVDGDDDADTFEAVARALDLGDAERRINRELARRLAERLRADGIEVLDLYPSMLAEPEPLYWQRDHHLNVQGCRHVAAEIRRHLGGRP